MFSVLSKRKCVHTACLYLGLAVIGLVIGGCASKSTSSEPTPHEMIVSKMIAKQQEIVALLQSVKDEPSAKAAAIKYMELEKEGRQLLSQATDLGEPSRRQLAAIKAKYDPQMKKIKSNLRRETSRILEDPKLSPYFSNTTLPNKR